MGLVIRFAVPEDDAAPALLYASAAAFYDRFAGGPERAHTLLRRVYPRPRHTASFDVCRLAVSDDAVLGALAGFPAADSDRLARRFLAATIPRLPAWRWPAVARQLRAARRLTPPVTLDAWYVDALAVAPKARRTGVARALLADAEGRARAAGARVLALETTLENAPARALYESTGFQPVEERRASERDVAALGVKGFVAYRKRLA